ncbi:MAG: hypothetical protein M1834_003157 [Cirrosporium novae-zelandiae]|nr:MAG: hypothetical protein M1834_003157 [Cirrosporium novae-zelandiae]
MERASSARVPHRDRSGSAVRHDDTVDLQDNVLQYVDPLIGTTNGGNVFAGASLPYGMAKAVADVDGDENQGGFASDGSNITGFSQMHDSGTGGSASLGNFALFPYTNCPGDEIDRCVFPKQARKTQFFNDTLQASPGYFAVTLDSLVNTAMTVSHHTTLYRFTFPTASDDGSALSPLILMDLTDLSDSRQDNGTISVDPDSARIIGNATFKPSFGSGTYQLHFCADFKGAAVRDTGIWVNSRASTEQKSLKISRGINSGPLPGGAFARFESPSTLDNSILARVGVSFISASQACQSAETEIPSFDFNSTYSAAVNKWEEKLSQVSVQPGDGVSEDLLITFYSGIYRTMMNPQNYTGENPLWESSEPYYDSFYCLWDSFRTQIPLLTIVDPVSVTSMIRSLIDTYVHEGWLPDCRMSLCKGYTQGGSNADVVLVDGYLKGLTTGIDWETGYEAVIQDAEVEPYDWSNEGRGGLTSWKTLGYIPVEDYDYVGFGTMTRSISRTLEYSYNDFVISSLAQELGGRGEDVSKYQQRSGNWKNLFKANQTSYVNGVDTGYVGFPQPKYLNQTFGAQDPAKCSNFDSVSICSLQNTGAETFESSIWEYQFFVPHDMSNLIKTLNGPTSFTNRLDYLHESGITYIGNEPSFLTVFQYHYAGRPGRSAHRSHYYIPSWFNSTTGGLPGNDDSGTMGAFVAFSMIGLFPVSGQNVYLITPPYFESVSITNTFTNKTATIRNVNFDSSYQAIYIQSAKLDNVTYTKNWIDHSFFTEGKTLELTLGLNESSWGTEDADLPPSLSTSTNSTSSSSSRRKFLKRGMGFSHDIGKMKIPRGGEEGAAAFYG